jgi:5,10-methenyltetrahydromethanopterin hydrogenase
MEISEPDDISDSDLHGDKASVAPQVEDEVNATVKKHPKEERGSLSVFYLS